MSEKIIRYLIRITGIVCILLAFSIFLKNNDEDISAKNASLEISDKIQKQKTYNLVASEDYAMPVDYVDRVGYIGQIKIPSESIVLPIASTYNFDQMYKTPTLYKGSYYSDDIVICAHNYKNHFKFLGTINIGEKLVLETVDGQNYPYIITNREIVEASDFDSIKKQSNEDWDLTLFTCTMSGTRRIMLRCQKSV